MLPVRCAVIHTPLRRDRARVFHLSASLNNSLHICAHNVRTSFVCLTAEPYGFDRDEEDEFLYGPSTTSAPGKQHFHHVRFSGPHESPLFLVSSSITLTIPTDAMICLLNTYSPTTVSEVHKEVSHSLKPSQCRTRKRRTQQQCSCEARSGGRCPTGSDTRTRWNARTGCATARCAGSTVPRGQRRGDGQRGRGCALTNLLQLHSY